MVTFCSSFYLPESIRWLVTEQRYREAQDGLQKIALVNGVKDFKVTTFKQEEEDIDLKESIKQSII